MKRIIFISCIAVILCLSACGANAQYVQKAALFYPVEEIAYGSNGVYLQTTFCESFQQTPEEILDKYLLGPSTPGLANPFPKGISIISIKQKGEHVTIVLSDNFADLSGIDLTTACTCLAKTAMGLTQSTSVTISCETQPIHADPSITITNDSIILTDTPANTPKDPTYSNE